MERRKLGSFLVPETSFGSFFFCPGTIGAFPVFQIVASSAASEGITAAELTAIAAKDAIKTLFIKVLRSVCTPSSSEALFSIDFFASRGPQCALLLLNVVGPRCKAWLCVLVGWTVKPSQMNAYDPHSNIARSDLVVIVWIATLRMALGLYVYPAPSLLLG